MKDTKGNGQDWKIIAFERIYFFVETAKRCRIVINLCHTKPEVIGKMKKIYDSKREKKKRGD